MLIIDCVMLFQVLRTYCLFSNVLHMHIKCMYSVLTFACHLQFATIQFSRVMGGVCTVTASGE